MNARELIERKKRGERLAPEAIAFLVDGFTAGRIPDYQMAAFLMAVWFRDLDRSETLALLDCMMRSGRVLDLSDIPGPKIDKHSTGGVGDKVSLPLAGIAAACGLRVPMISGRGLGHTGGTLDKLESIPGYRTAFEEAAYRRTLREVGATILGQSADLVPADRELYALRDVTATVDCVPLIAASILSKKFASGAEGVVMDIKVGSGAFMRDLDAARRLAEVLVECGTAFGRRVAVVFTRMEEPLGVAVGNAVEVVESVALLRGGGPDDLREVTLELAGEMLVLGGLAPDVAAGKTAAGAALASGAACERFMAMVRAHGGRLDPERPDCGLEIAPRVGVVTAPASGWLSGADGYAVGMAVVELGGGRQRKEDSIDPSVGLRWLVHAGEHAEAGAPVVEILARPGRDIAAVHARLQAALQWSETAVAVPQRILGRRAAR
jgi:pyrimidine-nucleoside phosphorylase/thymidine phosphorylase